MNWLARLMGLNETTDEIIASINEKTEDSIIEIKESYDQDVIKLNARIEEFINNSTVNFDLDVEKLDSKIKDSVASVEDAFYQGVVKLDRDAVYIIHFKENTPDSMIDQMQRALSERGINCVLIASDKVRVINM